MTGFVAQLEYRSRDAIFLLDRLISIGVHRDCERLAPVARLRDFFLKLLDRVHLDAKTCFEVDAWR